MACSDCNIPFTRSISSRLFYCIHCYRSTMLIPKVQFDITVTDPFVSDQMAEKMLHLSIQEIYKICQAKNHRQLFAQLCNQLGAATCKIQMKILFSRNHHDTSAAKLALLNYEKKHNATQPALMITAETTKHKVLDTISKPSSSKLKTAAPTKRD